MAESPQYRGEMTEPVGGSFPRLLATDEFKVLQEQEMNGAGAIAVHEQLAVTWRSLMFLALFWGALTTAFAASGMATNEGLWATLRSVPVLGWFIWF